MRTGRIHHSDILTAADLVIFHKKAACLTDSPRLLQLSGLSRPKLNQIQHCIEHVVRGIDLAMPINLTPLGAAKESQKSPAKSPPRAWTCCGSFETSEAVFDAPQACLCLESVSLPRFPSRVKSPTFLRVDAPVIIRNQADLTLVVGGAVQKRVMRLLHGAETALLESTDGFTLSLENGAAQHVAIPPVAYPREPQS